MSSTASVAGPSRGTSPWCAGNARVWQTMPPRSSDILDGPRRGWAAWIGELWSPKGLQLEFAGGLMKLLKSWAAFAAAAVLAAGAGVEVSLAGDPSAPQQEQDLPDLGSP